jgi:hypothetical protein
MEEIWRDIIEYEGLYQVSNLGNVKSIVGIRIDSRSRIYKLPLKVLKSQYDRYGYLHVSLYRQKKVKHKLIHRLVLEAFIGNCPKGNYANHKDGNRANNKLNNLEWCTPSENNLHAFRVLNRKPVYVCGIKNANAKLTDDKIRYAKELRQKGFTFQKIADELGIAKSHAKRIIDGKSWGHIL